MAVKLAKCGYIMTMPFVYLTNVIEWFRDNSGVWEVFSYIIVSIATLMYIGSKTEDIGAAILVVIALLYFGLYSLVLLIMQFVVNVLIDVVCLICYACSAINRACYTYMSSRAADSYEGYERYSGNSGADDTRSHNHTQEHKDNNGNRGYSESDGNEENAGYSSALDQQFAWAKGLYGMGNSYTIDQLRHRRRDLMKKCHPDEGGSKAMAQDINAAYDILSKHLVA